MITSAQILIICFAIFGWEHWASMQKIMYKPTYYVDLTTEFSKEVFFQLGKLFAWMSSFVDWLKLQKVAETLGTFVRSFIGLALSGFSFIEGYVSEILTYDISHNLIFFGSIILVALASYIAYIAHKKYYTKTKSFVISSLR